MVDPEINVAPEHVFHFSDGQKAHNLKDLRNIINTMDDELFGHHVDETNNDFANWVEFVYKSPDIAADLKKAQNQNKMVEVLDVELGSFGGKALIDEPIEELPKQPFEDPIVLTPPPQTLIDADGKTVHSISTDAPHTFIVKEFFWGLIAGLLLGIILFASLLYFGVFPCVC